MICNPRIGQTVQLWYADKWRSWVTIHGKVGTVVNRSHGKPRNHQVGVDGRRIIVPCGNIRKVDE